MTGDEKPAWLSAVQRPPASVPPNASGPVPLLFDAENRPITTALGWARRRAELSQAWRDFIGSIPNSGRDNSVKVVKEDRPAGVIRQLVTFEPEGGLPVEAYLLRPAGPGRGRPGAVVLHSTVDWTIRQPAGLEGPEALHIGLHLARRGYVAFCPRNYLWQYRRDNKLETAVTWLRQRHPGVKGMAKMLLDATRAVDVLAAQPDVNPRRIGAIGHSLGAKEVLYLAAFDERVRAAVSSEGGIGLKFSNWDCTVVSRRDDRAPRLQSGPRPGPGPVCSARLLVDRRPVGRRPAELAVRGGGAPGLEDHRRARSGRTLQSPPGTRLPGGRPNSRLRVARLVSPRVIAPGANRFLEPSITQRQGRRVSADRCTLVARAERSTEAFFVLGVFETRLLVASLATGTSLFPWTT